MKRTIIAALIALAPLGAQAQNWIELARTDSVTYSARARSGQFDRNLAGEAVYVALVQTHDRRTGSFTYSRMYVTAAACAAGYGDIVAVDPQSGRVKFSADFALGGRSAASGIADMLCASAVDTVERNRGTSQRY